MQPDVSVVIPTYNREEYLRQAIASCFEGNEEVDVEVVVVDDGSTDGTREYLEELDDDHVRPVFQEHQGGQVARNRGLSEVRGEYLKFLDDDDWLAPSALRWEVKALQRTGADVCVGTYQSVDNRGNLNRTLSDEPPDDFIAGVLRGTVTPHPLHLTYRRKIIDSLRWDPDVIGRQDLQFLVEVALQEPSFVHLGEIVGYRRLHEGEHQSERAARATDLSRVHASLLLRAVKRLRRENWLTSERRNAAVESLWTWAHVLSAYDWPAFGEMYEEICEVQADFRPEREHWLLTAIDQLVTPRMTEGVLYPFRKTKHLLWK